jgi:DNA-binding response OmpR family regulator
VTRILVVDDETALVELVRSYLEREQYEVLTAADHRSPPANDADLPTDQRGSLCRAY